MIHVHGVVVGECRFTDYGMEMCDVCSSSNRQHNFVIANHLGVHQLLAVLSGDCVNKSGNKGV